jgi:hypothetical protein
LIRGPDEAGGVGNTEAGFPHLPGWTKGAHQRHFLREVIQNVDQATAEQPVGTPVLAAFDELIKNLEEAAPNRLASVRGDFEKAIEFDDLWIVRSEMVAGAKLARCDVPFDFGQRGKQPEPDLLLRGLDLAIEVKSRRLDGLRDLHDELEAALEEANAPVTVHIVCNERPLYIKPDVRQELLGQTLSLVPQGSGVITKTLDQPWAATPRLDVVIRVFPHEPFLEGHRVFIEGGFELTNHMHDVTTEVIKVLTDEQKMRQAEAMPTVLLVDGSRVGLNWLRSDAMWARALAASIPEDTPFKAIAVMRPDLMQPDVTLSIGLREGLSKDERGGIEALASKLGATIA